MKLSYFCGKHTGWQLVLDLTHWLSIDPAMPVELAGLELFYVDLGLKVVHNLSCSAGEGLLLREELFRA